jgi:hypothetical protein
MNTLKYFVLWIDVPIEQVTHKKLLTFIDHLLDKRLKPKTINYYLDSIRGFYDYLIHEEEVAIPHPPPRFGHVQTDVALWAAGGGSGQTQPCCC